MDDDSRNSFDWQLFQFFVKIMRTVFYGMFWMMFNVFFGLYLGWADPETSTPLLMGIFYTWLVLSAVGFIYVLWRIWRKKMPPP